MRNWLKFRSLAKIHDHYEAKLDRTSTIEEYHSIHREYDMAVDWWNNKEARKKKIVSAAKKVAKKVRKKS